MKRLAALFLLLSLPAFAGLPPTSSKVVGDSANVTTFNYQFPNFTGTHTGTTISLGVNSVAGGGTGLGSGTSGGVPYFSSSSAMTSSGALTANGVVLGGGAGAAPTSTAAGTTGQVLTGVTGSAPTFQAAAVSISDPKELKNLGFAPSISSNTLVVALKQSDGSTDPSSGSAAVLVGFRSSTTTAASYTEASFTAAASITLATTDSIGCTSGVVCTLYVYLISDTTSDICLSLTQFDERAVQSASALTGGADTSGSTLWCTNAHTSKPIRLIGKTTATWSNPNWGTIAAPVSIVKGNDANIISGSSGLIRMEGVSVAACSSGTCTLTTKTSNWVTVAFQSTGRYDVTFLTGMFTAAPNCTCNVSGATTTGDCMFRDDAVTRTATAMRIETAAIGTGDLNLAFDLICVGPR